MSNRLKELREKRGNTVADMRAITEAAETAKRDLSAEELTKHGTLFGEVEQLRIQIEAAERQLEADRQIAARDGNREIEDRTTDPAKSDKKRPVATEEYRAAFAAWVQTGKSGMAAEEVRALSVGSGSQGGFTVMPEQMADGMIKFADDMVVIRSRATKLRVEGAASLGVLSLDADPSDADWTSELATGSEDTAMSFGKRKMVPNPLAKRIKVSNDLLRMSTRDIEGMVRARLDYKFGITQEKAFLLGNGTSQPLGLFVPSADGVPAGRDVSNGNTTTGMTFDGLISAKYSLKDQYRNSAGIGWLFHRNAVEQIAKLKDSQNRYLWQPSVQEGQPDRILNIPVLTSEYVPNTFTTGLYVGMLADFSFYWIVDSMGMEMQRLVELYAEQNQTGFICRQFTDGQPVLAEAFTRIKLG